MPYDVQICQVPQQAFAAICDRANVHNVEDRIIALLSEVWVAPQLTVVTSTIARSGVAVSVKDVHAASVVPSETAAHETTAVRASSSNGQ